MAIDHRRLIEDLKCAAMITDETDPFGAGMATGYQVIVAALEDGDYNLVQPRVVLSREAPGVAFEMHRRLSEIARTQAADRTVVHLFPHGRPPAAKEPAVEGIRPT